MRTIIEFISPMRDVDNFIESSIYVNHNAEDVKKMIANLSFNNSFEEYLE